MVGRDLAREVTIAEARTFAGEGDGPRIAALDTGIKHSIVRNFTSRGATLDLLPVHGDRRRAAVRRPRRDLPRPRPRRPGRARLHRRHRPLADRAQAGVRHLPRPPAALARGRARDVQAPVRPPRRQPPGQGPAHRADRDHVAEPRLRGPRRAGHAAAVGLRRGRADAREPLRRDGRGAAAARRPRRLRPVPPRGRPGPERLARPVRRLPRGARRCRVETTSTRSSSSAPARS